MAFCESNKMWSMDLVLDNDTSKVERLAFDVVIDANGGITGFVRDSNGERMSQIRGQCEGPKLPGIPVSLMTFIFRVRKGALVRGVHLSGIAHPPLERPTFRGKLRVFTQDINTPPSEGIGTLQTIQLSPDSGDTGTGTGQQT
jgi:hypothetical protein